MVTRSVETRCGVYELNSAGHNRETRLEQEKKCVEQFFDV